MCNYIHLCCFNFKKIFLATLPMPHVSVQNTMWTFTSPDGSQVERYIVEFECRVRNITFVETCISVMSNSGGTGRVSTNVSCFGGIGQLYRVKVWAVSGHNISHQPAVRCLTPDGRCTEGGRCTRNKHIVLPSIVVKSNVCMVSRVLKV